MAVPVDLHPLLVAFKDEVCDKSRTIDPSGEYDWYALSIGFFLAKGASVSLAEDLACKARYTHEYWS